MKYALMKQVKKRKTISGVQEHNVTLFNLRTPSKKFMGPTQDMVKKSSVPLTVVECLPGDGGIAGSSHTRGSVIEQGTLSYA